jgi:hypothetical protein
LCCGQEDTAASNNNNYVGRGEIEELFEDIIRTELTHCGQFGFFRLSITENLLKGAL